MTVYTADMWLCEVRGLIPALRYGESSYAGNYRLVYFEDFKVLQQKTAKGWQFRGKPLPLRYRGGVYGAMKACEA